MKNTLRSLIIVAAVFGAFISVLHAEQQPQGAARVLYTGYIENGVFKPVYGSIFVEGMAGGLEGLKTGTNVVFGPESVSLGTRQVFYPWDVVSMPAWQNYASVTNDSFATEWWVNNLIDSTVGRLTVVGRKELLEAYTNYPPTAITNLNYYVGECIRILAATEVAPEVDNYTNAMHTAVSILSTGDGIFSTESNVVKTLDSRISDLEDLKKRPAIGGGTEDFDWVLDLNVDDLDMEDMLKAIRALTLYVKQGKTNGFEKVR